MMVAPDVPFRTRACWIGALDRWLRFPSAPRAYGGLRPSVQRWNRAALACAKSVRSAAVHGRIYADGRRKCVPFGAERGIPAVHLCMIRPEYTRA